MTSLWERTESFQATTSAFDPVTLFLHLDHRRRISSCTMESTMAVSYHDRPFRFFDLPREIRNDIYTRMTSFYDDFPMITLAPKGASRTLSANQVIIELGYINAIRSSSFSLRSRVNSVMRFCISSGMETNSMFPLKTLTPHLSLSYLSRLTK